MGRNNQIVIVEKSYNGKIEIEVEEFRKLLEEAYDNGYCYGIEVGKNSIHNYYSTIQDNCNSNKTQVSSSSTKDMK